ncbi:MULTISPECIES: bestrophin family protein [unclassified Polaromonas]|uniref:bestrophin family protein n=1 Tax=unclassified Polaromonas TaxID=2638319 RepID=UPI0018CB32A6|nr:MULTISPECIES: bestrophin family protein [unclassified Polaromonas]MBG6073034.1 putative membrane protein [Polaromonas sp. CG_9.7]MBG6115039.1 putative membrane protein [Polaromonas sp. CG_9.2]MDH6186038.1 putative membrane protein [Polaromonas sp. CG_23.6]
MIVRDRPSGIRLFLVVRGSILKRIRFSLLANTLSAVVVTVVHGNFFALKITLTTIPFTLMALPLAIFLGFRNSAAYDRYWEGRKLWGELVLRCRSLSRQCQSFIQPVSDISAQMPDVVAARQRMVYRTIAFVHALRLQLRDQSDYSEIRRWVPQAEWSQLQTVSNKHDRLVLEMGKELGQCQRRGWIDPCLAVTLDNTLSALNAAAASCERIKSTPIPFSYTLLLHRTAYLYCFLLPFGLVDTIGFMTPFVVAIVAYTFFGLDALGDEIEEPFGMEANDLPLDTLCRAIEINLLESLDETELPAQLQPVNYCLT